MSAAVYKALILFVKNGVPVKMSDIVENNSFHMKWIHVIIDILLFSCSEQL